MPCLPVLAEKARALISGEIADGREVKFTVQDEALVMGELVVAGVGDPGKFGCSIQTGLSEPGYREKRGGW